MRMWLVKVGEPLPLTGNERLLRMGLVANILADRGHEVVWWTSTFDHAQRTQRFGSDHVLSIKPNYRIAMLWSPGYRRSLSLARLRDHWVLAARFTQCIKHVEPPHLIFCAFPTIELALACTRLGTRTGTPVVVDVRDLWPDIFALAVPPVLRHAAKLALFRMVQMTKMVFKQATAVTGITPSFVEWGLRYGGRTKTDLDQDFPLAYPGSEVSREAIGRAFEFWRAQGVAPERNEMIACFFGTLGHQLDMETVIKAAARLRSRPIRFVLCGEGDRKREYQLLAKDLDNVLFPGWVGSAEISTLMSLSCIGLAPYRSTFSFMRSIPNKAIEYLSGGLAIVTSLKGMLRELVETEGCGCYYDNGDVDGLVRILVRLLESPSDLGKMSKAAVRLFRERFAAETVYSRLADHLETIARRKGSGVGKVEMVSNSEASDGPPC